MSHWNLDKKEDLRGFQLTMYRLVKERYPQIFPGEKSNPGPSDIANKLYDSYYYLVAPKGYRDKHSEFKDRNLKAIKKCVERDFLKVNPWEVSSSYMYAYSLLFKVSLDFLYGKEEYFTDDYDVLQICKKTHLSEKAVEKLLSDEEVYICDFPINDIQDAIYEDSEYESVINFWNSIIESDLYTELPENYFRMACSQFFYQLASEDEKKLHYEKASLPSKEEFVDTVDEYSALGNSVCTGGKTLEEIYDQDKEHALDILKDILNQRWSEADERLSQIKSIFWGCSGQFDRFVQNYFHDQASKYKVKLYNSEEDDEY